MSSPVSHALRATLSPQSLKRTMDELLAGDTPAAAPPAQPTFTTLADLTASPHGELQVTEEQDESATPSSHESVLVLGEFVVCARRRLAPSSLPHRPTLCMILDEKTQSGGDCQLRVVINAQRA